MVEQKSVNFLVKCSNHFESFNLLIKLHYITCKNHFIITSVLVKWYNMIFRLLYYRFESYIHLQSRIRTSLVRYLFWVEEYLCSNHNNPNHYLVKKISHKNTERTIIIDK